ncbi:MAG: glycerophosphodiester phosphodiesterase [Bacillota bacterium]
MRECPSDVPDIVAHRGLHVEYPENSIGAMKAAWKAGFQWAECDIHLSADKEFVVLHDEKLDRTTTGRGVVSQFAWSELQSLSLRGPAGKPTSEKLPLLGQLLEAMPASAGLLVEVKAVFSRRDVERLLELLKPHRFILQSFNLENIKLIHECNPRIAIAFLVDDAAKLIKEEQIKSIPGASINANFKSLDVSGVRQLHDAGKWAGAWTVNSEGDIRRMLGINVDTIITDEPARVARLMSGV